MLHIRAYIKAVSASLELIIKQKNELHTATEKHDENHVILTVFCGFLERTKDPKSREIMAVNGKLMRYILISIKECSSYNS